MLRRRNGEDELGLGSGSEVDCGADVGVKLDSRQKKRVFGFGVDALHDLWLSRPDQDLAPGSSRHLGQCGTPGPRA
jgi:hypothetical protein